MTRALVMLSCAAALATLAPLSIETKEEDDTHALVAEPADAEAAGDEDGSLDAVLVPVAAAAEPESAAGDTDRETPADDLDDADPGEISVIPPIPPVRWTATALLTFYAPGCGDSGRTATGTRPTHGTVAADPRVIPFHTRVEIEGYPGIYTVLDTGSGVRGWHLDMWVATCQQARTLGRQTRAVRVLG